MDNESSLRRPAPKTPYRRSAAQLVVPKDALDSTLMLLRRAGSRESGLFWYGRRSANGNGVVEAVAAPRQRMTWGNYSISTNALAEIVSDLGDDLKPLAQVHSHPGDGVEHSIWDDRLASSRRSLSLVFPRYGTWAGRFPDRIGVHEFQDDYWHLLSPADAAARVVLANDKGVHVIDKRGIAA